MYRLAKDYEEIQEIKKSKFITFLHRCDHEQEAKDFISQVKKLHPDANHHCYAFILDDISRSNDDGEPHGTAGMPMLEALKNSDTQDIVAVVVRYFGGILLGTGGLVRAYGNSVSSALKNAERVMSIQVRVYELSFSYDLIGKIDYLFTTKKIEVLDKKYEESVTYTFYTLDHTIELDIQEMTSGKFLAEFIEEKIIDVKI